MTSFVCHEIQPTRSRRCLPVQRTRPPVRRNPPRRRPWLPWIVGLAIAATANRLPAEEAATAAPLVAVPLEGAGELVAPLAAVLGRPQFAHAHWGLLVEDLSSGEPLAAHNADKLFAPASTTKLFSAAALLDAFGADHRFQTAVVRRGELAADGALTGDLILVASGDLTLGGRTDADGRLAYHNVDHTYAGGSDKAELTAPDPLAGLNALAQQVAAAGIRRIIGEVLIDDRLFERSESTGSGPEVVTPIVVNDNVLDVLITPAAGGAPASLTWRPQTALFGVSSEVMTVGPGESSELRIRQVDASHFVVTGKIAADSRPLLRVQEVPDAAAFARALWIEALARAGIQAELSLAAPREGVTLPAAEEIPKLPRVARLDSPPLTEELRLVLKVSHNLHASAFPLLLAARHGQRRLSDGMRWEREFLKRAGVDVEAISFGGGAGGARSDFVTPRATCQLLRYLATRPDFAVFEQALPVLGIDGTLADAVRPDSPARGAVAAKTGTFYWQNTLNDRYLLLSKALAGYLTAASGRRLAFAIFVNHVHLHQMDERAEVGRVLGELCEILHARL